MTPPKWIERAAEGVFGYDPKALRMAWDDAMDDWHSDDTDTSLREYIGLSHREYAALLTERDAIVNIIARRRAAARATQTA